MVYNYFDHNKEKSVPNYYILTLKELDHILLRLIVLGFDVPYSLPYQRGFIGVELFDVKGLARETIKLLKDYNYRKQMGALAKKSLDVFKNNETAELWGRLCDSLLSSDREDYRKLQKDIENSIKQSRDSDLILIFGNAVSGEEYIRSEASWGDRFTLNLIA